MKWRKLGLIKIVLSPTQWLDGYAAVPFAENIGGDLFRIFFSTRDLQNRSHVLWAEVDLRDPTRILRLADRPVLSPGVLGCFDDSGAMATWLAKAGGKRYLYYIGWNLRVTVPFHNSIGLATSVEDAPFTRYADGPVIDRTMREPHFCASCCVLPGADCWRMWYLSCVGWSVAAGRPLHHYHIKYAESDDGINWRREGKVAIDLKGDGEYAISRPTVMRDRDCWRMWYSYRGSRYRIGYAESLDGITWSRQDDRAGIEASVAGWDSEMIEYPHVFDHNGRRYMLYNGNGYGRTGFGLAVLESA